MGHGELPCRIEVELDVYRFRRTYE